MCSGLTERSLPPGSSKYVEKAWELKEDIREEMNIFHYDRDLFSELYTEEYAYVILPPNENEIIGLAIIRERGYMSLLAVDSENRGQGIGKSLLHDSLEDFDTIKCHVRETNKNAIEFYKKFGFEVESVEEEYYDNGDDGIHMAYDSET